MVTAPEHVLPLATTPSQDTVYEPVAQRKVVGAGAAFAVAGSPNARVNEAVITATIFMKSGMDRCFFDSALVLASNSGGKGETLWHELFFNMRMELPLSGR